MTNTVTLLGIYGSDERVALSAWQSTSLELDVTLPENFQERVDFLFNETQKTKKKNYKELLKFLAEHKHHTPWEKSLLDFQVSADIATHIHCLKHRVGVSINTESARYKELSDCFYVPEDWAGLKITTEDLERYERKNPGTFIHDCLKNEPLITELLRNHTEKGNQLYHIVTDSLTKYLGRKRAKESARFFLGYNKTLNYDMCFNLRSFAHFCHLRAKPEAQVEVKEIAKKMVQLVLHTEKFDTSLEVLGLTN